MKKSTSLGLRFISDLPLTRGLHYSLIFAYIFAPICLHNLYLPALNFLFIPGSLAFADSQFFQFYSSQRNCIFSTSVFLSFTLQSNMILTSLLPLNCVADRFLVTLYLRVRHLFILSSWNSCKLFLPAFHAFCGAFSLVTWSLGVFIRCPALWAVFIPLPLYSGYLWLVWIYFSFKKNPILTPSCVIGKEST